MNPTEEKTTEEKTAKVEKVFKRSLGELDMQLPIGVPDDAGRLHKNFSVRPWTFDLELELGELRDKNRKSNLSQYVSMIVSTLCTKVGPNEFDHEDKKAETARRLLISEMFAPDVFYIYVWLRAYALGNDLDLDLTCPTCTTPFSYAADLSSLEVEGVEELAEANYEYTFDSPFELRKKKLEKVILGPMRWNTLENAEKSGLNTGKAKAQYILGSIKEYCGIGPAMVVMNELGKMTKLDFEQLAALVDDHTLGPDMQITDDCPHCHREFNLGIDWSYDNFFGISSR